MHRLRIVFHNFLYIFAIIVLLIALLFSLARGLTPLLNIHKHWFEMLATRFIGQPVLIGKVKASFSGVIPKFAFHNVTILTAVMGKPLLSLTSLQVGIDIPRTLLQRHLIANYILIDGVSVRLKKDKNGKFSLNGETLGVVENTPLISDGWLTCNAIPIVNWILAQRFISLKNITFYWDASNKGNFAIQNLDFILINRNNSHRLRSGAGLFNRKNTTFKLAADLNGNIKQRDSWSGTVYWQGNHLPLSTWFNQVLPNLQVNHGYGKVALWIDLKQGNVSVAQAQLDLHELNLVLAPQNKKIALTKLKGGLYWQRNVNGSWSMAAKKLQWINGNQIWPLEDLILMVDNTRTLQSIYWQQLDLQLWRTWINANKWLPDNILKNWGQYNPRGQLNQVAIFHTGAWQDLLNVASINLVKTTYVRSKFNKFSLNAVGTLPGAEQLNGELIWRPDGGKVRLDSYDGNLLLPSLFTHSLPFTQLKGDVVWQQRNAKCWVKLVNLQIKNDIFNSVNNASIYFPADKSSPYFDLLSKFNQYDSVKLKNFLPSKIMAPPLLSWLNNAFIAGEGGNGVMVMRGKVADFPYLKKQGQFIADAQVKNLTLHYADNWPSLYRLNGRLRFDPTGMYFNVSSGIINGHSIYNTQAKIPLVLSDAESVNVKTQVNMDVSDAINFTQTTPLKKHLSKLHNVQGQGKTQLDLHLKVPLNSSQLDHLVVDGKLSFVNGMIKLPNWGLTLEKLNGLLNFTTEKMWAKNMKANFFNHPANIQIKTVKMPTDSITRFIIDSHIDIPILKTSFNYLPLKVMQGSTSYHGVLNLASKGEVQNLQINSDLQGISIDLPRPYGKSANVKHPFDLQAKFTMHDTNLNFSYPPEVAGNLLYLNDKKSGNSLQRGVISLGERKANLPTQNGLIVTGYIPEFSWIQWQPYWQKYSIGKEALQLDSKTKADSTTAIESIRLLDLRVGKINIFDQTIIDAKLKIQRSPLAWQADIVSTAIAGRVTYPDTFPKQAVTANFSHCYFNPAVAVNKVVIAATEKLNKLKPKDIPPIKFSAADFHYGNRQLGAIKLDFIPIYNRGEVKFNATINSAALHADINSNWKVHNGYERTYLTGNVNFADLGAGLKAMGVTNKVLNGKGKLNFQLTWPKSPFLIDEKSLSGKAKLYLKNSTIIGFNQQINRKLGLGKLLNLFSVQNLLQRLRLNFSDLTRSGYNFNSWQSSYEFKPGKISTSDTVIEGNVANIYLWGEADIRQENYNLMVKIVPNYTASFVLLAFLGGPVAGVTALVANQIIPLGSLGMNKVVEQSYVITGPWANPRVTKLEK